jgi:predicted transposase YdaD
MDEGNGMGQPHDALFKRSFQKPENAVGLLRALVPEGLGREVEWAGLRLLPGSQVDAKLRRRETDLLYEVPVKEGKLYLYVLLEHQSRYDRSMPVRLLRYMVGIWERQLRAEPLGKLPVVLPIVLGQNAKPWEGSQQLEELLAVPEGMEGIWDYIPRYRYVLYELARHGYEALPGTAVGKLTLRVLKAQRLSDWLSEKVWDEGLMREALADLESLILYIYRLSALDSVQLEEKLSKLKDLEVRKKAMTLAEKLMNEGWQKGEQEGWQRGRQEGEVAARGALRVLLEKRFGELGEAEEMRLEAADLEKLKEWTGAVLDVESLEALFGE